MIEEFFEIIYTFEKSGSVSNTIVFFFGDDSDDIYKVSIHTSIFKRLRNNNKLQTHLRRLYDYHKTSVVRIDDVEMRSIYKHFELNENKEMCLAISIIVRNRKIDSII